ncbi:MULTISPECIES: SRPBCC family protein [Brevibacterium]|uniref:Polyketide cyclase n=2 Tax=Brevibacterium TaxID=1696 RepID=A0AB34XSS8_9MICO|nr:SRPBCC domain-containing protein [Brevibacterium casei]NJE67556.1 SRPBCC domain-containing protein [Brevibacterium sp. LS14]SIG84148.1 activator of Hsp90 ATPase 1-like protein [Mycobacteroides abscessus subsp. abscessus]KZE21670.1 polyketide cyclase [Brevibacterium casei]MCT2182937.1 SRPBCC domain-containing protein [Brevibacterium casei]MDH5148369.1 SRPBCC domain-containing protein [Brevibacterium casei]
MPVTETSHDEDTKTLTMVARFAAPPERVWDVYADPRQLERVWGPPTYPATVVDHALEPGGRVTYFMTSPEGERYYGLWEVTAVDAPHSFEFTDWFADESFTIDENLPGSTNTYTFTPDGDGTKAVCTSVFDSVEGLRTVLEMGVVEGATEAIGQIDDLLARG